MNLSLLCIMSFVIAISYWLEEHTRWVAHISGVLLIIIIASVLGSAGLISSSSATYSWQIEWLVPFGIILMLLAFNPRNIFKINKDFLLCFFIGAIATGIGALIAGILFKKMLPQDYWRVSGQLAASFIGGYENGVSVGTGLNTPIPVFLKVFAGDSVLTTLWIIVNIFQGRSLSKKSEDTIMDGHVSADNLSNPLDLTSLAITIMTAFGILAISFYIHKYHTAIPQMLIASVISTLLTFTPLRHRFSGAYVFGALVLSYFIFGCGAISNIPDLFGSATMLVIFPATVVLIHAAILFGIANLLNIKKEVTIVASQCLIGGPATALAVVTARKWNYQFEAVGLGLLGYAIGNYFGFGVAWILK